MKFSTALSFVFVAVGATSAQSTTVSSSGTGNANPCALLSASAASYKSAHPKETTLYVKPSEVYACQKDVPIVPSLAAAQIEWMQGFIQFQSTLAWLKNPTPEYELSPVDLVGALDDISKKSLAGQYNSEYDLEIDIYNLFASAGDGHLAYTPYLIGAFAYFHDVTLVSISTDGVQLPKVYFQEDVKALNSDSSSFNPSPLVSIDGQDVNQYILSFGYDTAFQDLDARFNVQFYNPSTAQYGNGKAGEGNGAYYAVMAVHHNDETVYVFENSTKHVLPNKALVPLPFDFKSGKELLERIISPPSSSSSLASPSATMTASASSSSSGTTSTASPATNQIPGYPYPQVIHSGGYISGYFLDGSNYSNVAVLSIPSFLDTQDNSLVVEFQKVLQSFLGKCQSAKKTHLIIDVRGNGGGTAFLAYDSFKQLFPSMIPYSGSRLRVSPAAYYLGEESSKIDAIDPNNATTDGWNTPFNSYTSLKSPDGASWVSWKELYGPVHSHGDIFTNVEASRFSDPVLDIDESGIVVSGYANNTDILPQIFASENITLLTDAACTSTCGLFSNLLINQGNVKTITAGGRPNTNPIVAIGGSQGAESFFWSDLATLAQSSINVARLSTGNDSEETKDAIKALEPLTKPPPLQPFEVSSSSLNLKDNIAAGDTSLTPLQFTKKYADCRFFYMPGDLLNVTYTWERIVRGAKSLCINGSTGGNSTGNLSVTTSTPLSGASTTQSQLVYTGGAAWGGPGFAAVLTVMGMLWTELL